MAILFSISYGSVLIFFPASNSLSKQWGGWQQKAIIKKASSQFSKQVCVFSSQIVYRSISVFDIQSVGNGALSGVCVCDMHWASWLIFQGMISPSLTSKGVVQGRRLQKPSWRNFLHKPIPLQERHLGRKDTSINHRGTNHRLLNPLWCRVALLPPHCIVFASAA